jgi:hypothetical protein
MQVIADTRGDPMSRFHNAIYAGDVEGRIAVLRDVGLRERSCQAWVATFLSVCYRSISLLNGKNDRAG